jgi:glycosyltransferase involved in cell wall biosynthesis
MSVLESMAFAKPVVGGRIGGIPEQIRDKVDGILFEPGNVQALADVLDDLALNPQKAKEMGLNARQRLREKYSLCKHTESLLALYQEILTEK